MWPQLAMAAASIAASQLSKKDEAETSSTSTTQPVVPKALKRAYIKKSKEGPQHFLPPEMRAQIFAQMQGGAERRAKVNDSAIAARTGGNTSSLGYQYLQTLNNQGLQSSTAQDIANVDVQDLYKGEEKRRYDLNSIFNLMNLETGSASTVPTKPKPGLDLGAILGSAAGSMGVGGGKSGTGGGMFGTNSFGVGPNTAGSGPTGTGPSFFNWLPGMGYDMPALFGGG